MRNSQQPEQNQKNGEVIELPVTWMIEDTTNSGSLGDHYHGPSYYPVFELDYEGKTYELKFKPGPIKREKETYYISSLIKTTRTSTRYMVTKEWHSYRSCSL